MTSTSDNYFPANFMCDELIVENSHWQIAAILPVASWIG